MLEPNFGDAVQVRPRVPGVRVQSSAGSFGVFMPDEWQDRIYDEWLHRRFRDGSIEMRPPPQAPADEEK